MTRHAMNSTFDEAFRDGSSGTETGPLPAGEESVTVRGFAVTYDRKFNLGNFESLNPAITIWVRSRTPEGGAFDLHHARERVRRMARENVRAQLLRQQGDDEVVFLGLQPPLAGVPDPIYVRTVSVSLGYRVNLGDDRSIVPAYTDWADVRRVAGSPGELHVALDRMWRSLWANVADELSRARGQGATDAFFGLPPVADLTASHGQGLGATLTVAGGSGG